MAGKKNKQKQRQAQVNHRRGLLVNTPQRPPPEEEKWKVVERPRRQPKKTQRQQPVLATTQDNDAQRAWRDRGMHSHTITIPPDLVHTGEHQEYLDIAQRYGAYVGPITQAGANVYGIWGGTTQQAAAVRQALHDWIQQRGESKNASGQSNFGKKQRSMTVQYELKMDRRWEREVQRHEYRQAPAIGSVFERIGTFHWPADEMDPQEVLGQSLEALDAIRVDCGCHIILDDEGLIKVLGNDEGVTEAIVRIRMAFFQIIARQHRALEAHLLHWEDPTTTPAALCPQDHFFSDLYDLLEDAHQGATFEAQSWEDESSIVPLKSLHSLKAVLMHAITRLRYYAGDITFRLQLGTFVAIDYVPPKNKQYYTISELANMLEDSRFSGEVIPEIKTPVKHMLRSIMQGDEILPRDFNTATAAEVLPCKRARFRFQVEGTTYELVMDWQEEQGFDGSTRLDVVSQKWLKFDAGQEEQHQLLNANLIKLDNGMAWNFDICATQLTSQWRLPSILERFASRVKLNTKQDPGTPFVVFIAGGTGLVSLKTSTIYNFQLKDSDWRLDVSLVQQWKYNDLKVGASSKPAQSADPQWVIQMHHAVWEEMFNENKALPVGAGAKWSSDVKTWFPTFISDPDEDADEGFRQMIKKMDYVEKLLNVKFDRATGMSVG